MTMITHRHALPVMVIGCLVLTASFVAAHGGNIRFDLKNADPVVFSHELHTKSKGVKCMACHFRELEQVGGSFQIKKEKLNKRDFCNNCHNGMKSFDAQSTKNCSRCHKK